jgi:hypothetical protein
MFFGRAPAVELLKLFDAFVQNEQYSLPWNRFCNTSSDSPNKDTLHIVHTAFHKGISSMPLEVDQFAFDLHAWFKRSPCQLEDFHLLANGTDLSSHQSLFFRHVSTRWLTLKPALERISERWADAKTYFLVFLGLGW